jgi:asparagine synthase (glutamine-hydrolysing)
MCGIAGLLKFNHPVTPDDVQGVRRMMDAQVHRGPDDSGLYQDEHVVLGHRRLSIIDLSSSGHQPMLNEDESICVIFNGEIYNWLEIRRELELLDYKFRSNSDTEVIVKAYQEWGEESFKRIIGMFSLCIFDRQRHYLYLLRDHAGIKPLYYYLSKERVVFASEVRGFKTFDRETMK